MLFAFTVQAVVKLRQVCVLVWQGRSVAEGKGAAAAAAYRWGREVGGAEGGPGEAAGGSGGGGWPDGRGGWRREFGRPEGEPGEAAEGAGGGECPAAQGGGRPVIG